MDESPASRRHPWFNRAWWLAALIVFAWAWAVFAWSAHASALRTAGVGLAGATAIVLAWRRRQLPTAPAMALGFAALAAAAAAWLIRPSDRRAWAPDFAEVPWADVQGDLITLHNYRNFDWRSATEAVPRWETRTFPLSALRHIDFIMTYWGSPHICHTMVSFDFGAHGRICASIEARREAGDEYSPLAGAFRRYELIYILADERDLLRVRTNFRPNNEVYLYRLTATPEAARVVFMDYLQSANALRHQPAWYHSIVTNCTTLIRQHARPLHLSLPWDWRLVANGYAHEYLYRLGYLPRDLPLAELKQRSHITPAARQASREDFPDEIRRGRPGF